MPRDRWAQAQRLSAAAVEIGDRVLPRMSVTVRPKLRAGAGPSFDWQMDPADAAAWSFSLLAAKGLRREVNGTTQTVRVWARLASLAEEETLLIEFPAASVRGTCCRVVGESSSATWAVTTEDPPA